LFRFVDFGEVSEACAPSVTGEAAQPFGQSIDGDHVGAEWANFKANRLAGRVTLRFFGPGDFINY
jgi:hypothetical protein